MRRCLPALLLAFAVVCPTWAADDPLRVLADAEAAREMMPRYLMGQADAAFDRWQTEYEARTTPEAIADYQRRMREFFVTQLGGFPERTPLNARVTGTVDRDRYRVEKVLFESQPKHYVTAALFLPTQEKFKRPYPAVLVVCGHSAEGKAYDGYQRACALLALNGIAALIVDPIAQGERHQLLTDDGKPVVPSSTTEHSLTGLGSILLGQNTARFEMWDDMRGLDYLQSRPEIDPERLGVMGNSGGGTQTAYLMALDDRIKAASPSCYITTFERLLNTIGPQDAEQDIFGQIAHGMDHADYLMMRAPTPILLCTATKDFFDIGGAWQSFRAAKRLYSRMGHAERISLVEHDAKHGYAQPLREAAVRWMLRWLAGRDEAITEPDIDTLTVAEMQVTPRGQVMLLDGARSVFDLNRSENERLAAQRKKLWQNPQQAFDKVRALAGIRKLDELPAFDVQTVGTLDRDGLKITKLIVAPEQGIQLPAVVLRPTNGQPRGAVLYLDEVGKSSAAQPNGEAERLARDGWAVLAVDVRGVGETHPEKAAWYDKRFGSDSRHLMIAYLLGRSYVGMRAEDILTCARWLSRQDDLTAGKPVRLIATGHLGTPALHAAALEPQLFDRVTLHQPLVSWSSLLDAPVNENQLVHILHGGLTAYDLPDLAKSLGKKLELVDPRTAAGEPAQR